MEHTIEQIQNDIMNRMQQFDFGDRVTNSVSWKTSADSRQTKL